jgi:hypothetical protein
MARFCIKNFTDVKLLYIAYYNAGVVAVNAKVVGLFIACARRCLPVVPVNRMVDRKRIIGKNGGGAQEVADQKTS